MRKSNQFPSVKRTRRKPTEEELAKVHQMLDKAGLQFKRKRRLETEYKAVKYGPFPPANMRFPYQTPLRSYLSEAPQMKDISEKARRKLYWSKVKRITDAQDTSVLLNSDKQRGLFGPYHLDHIISVNDGYKHYILPEIIGHISNLRIVPVHVNVEKGIKSDVDLHASNVAAYSLPQYDLRDIIT